MSWARNRGPQTIGDGWAKYVCVDTWEPDRDYEIYSLSQRQLADAPFRISFVITSNSSHTLSPVVIPLQQCVRQSSETVIPLNQCPEPVWFRKPADLVGFFEPTPVSRQLDEYLDRFPHRHVNAVSVSTVVGPLKKFLLPVMYPKTTNGPA